VTLFNLLLIRSHLLGGGVLHCFVEGLIHKILHIVIHLWLSHTHASCGANFAEFHRSNKLILLLLRGTNGHSLLRAARLQESVGLFCRVLLVESGEAFHVFSHWGHSVWGAA